MTNLKQVLRKVKEFQSKHLQLHDFRFGDVTEFLSNGDIKYPALFCDLESTDIDRAEKVTIFNLSFWLADLSNLSGKTRSNEIDVLSDLTEIAQDLISLFEMFELQDEWEIKAFSNIQYILNGNADCAIVLKFDIGIAVDFIPNACKVPYGTKGNSNIHFDYDFDFYLIDEDETATDRGFDYAFDFVLVDEPAVNTTAGFDYNFDFDL